MFNYIFIIVAIFGLQVLPSWCLFIWECAVCMICFIVRFIPQH